MVIGKKGEDIELLQAELQKMLGVPVHVNIEEVRKPETRRAADRRLDRAAAREADHVPPRDEARDANAMRLGAQGIKIMSAGRLNGIEIARTEWYREGRVPLHTLRAEIDYGFSEAKTTYGVIGIKVWVFKGEVMQKRTAIAPAGGAGAGTPGAGAAPTRPQPKPKKRRAAGEARAGAKSAATSKT